MPITISRAMTKILAIQSEFSENNRFLKFLESKGFYVTVANNGVIGVSKAQLELPDLIIGDILIPELDGYGVLKALREHYTTVIIPFIFLTAHQPSQADIRKAMDMGADDFLTQSCTEEEFLKAVRIRLERHAFCLQWYAVQINQEEAV